jgi:hypothetical protein
MSADQAAIWLATISDEQVNGLVGLHHRPSDRYRQDGIYYAPIQPHGPVCEVAAVL